MWNLDRTHKVGELVAAAAVVLSLLFVGIEVQQNNNIQKQLATRSLVRDWSDAVAAYADPELACLFVRFGNDRENLTAPEATRIETVLWRIYKIIEEIHYQYEEGMIDESVWNGFRQNLIVEASFENFRTWWAGYERVFSPRFRKLMNDDILATTAIDPEPYFHNRDCDSPVGPNYWTDFSVDYD